MTFPCDNINFFETEVRCEDGELNVYRRNINVEISDWYEILPNCCSSSSSMSSSSAGPIEPCVDCESFGGSWPTTITLTIDAPAPCGGIFTLTKSGTGCSTDYLSTTIITPDIGCSGTGPYTITYRLECCDPCNPCGFPLKTGFYLNMDIIDTSVPTVVCSSFNMNLEGNGCCNNTILLQGTLSPVFGSNGCNTCCGETLDGVLATITADPCI